MLQHNLTPQDLFEQGEGKKNHNTAITSIESFKALNESGQRLRERAKVLEILTDCQPLTSRSISNILGIERTNITRSLFDLVNETNPRVKVAYIDKCPVTNKKVKWYALKDWPQIKLFTS